MRHIPIKPDMLALLMTVIGICMTTLGILAFSTARADLHIAEKYADTVQNRYALEKEGQAFLREVQKAQADGRKLSELPDTETDENGVTWKKIEENDFSLVIGIVPDEDRFRIISWKLEKTWIPEENKGKLWNGE